MTAHSIKRLIWDVKGLLKNYVTRLCQIFDPLPLSVTLIIACSISQGIVVFYVSNTQVDSKLLLGLIYKAHFIHNSFTTFLSYFLQSLLYNISILAFCRGMLKVIKR